MQMEKRMKGKNEGKKGRSAICNLLTTMQKSFPASFKNNKYIPDPFLDINDDAVPGNIPKIPQATTI